MKLKDFFEEWKATIKFLGEVYEIFVNPTRKDLRDIKIASDVARYIIDFEKKKLYVFSAELMHIAVAKELGIPYDFNKKIKGYKFGEGYIKDDMIIYTVSGEAKGFKEKWLEKYFKEI